MTEEVPDFYTLLDCRDNASDKEIQKAFRRQAIKYHPDKNPTVEAATRFHLLTIALDTLTDPEKRRPYDASRAQKIAQAQRRQKVEGERRAWIDELERSEREAGTGKRRHHNDSASSSKVEELSRLGAQMRAQLAARMKTPKRSASVPQSQPHSRPVHFKLPPLKSTEPEILRRMRCRSHTST